MRWDPDWDICLSHKKNLGTGVGHFFIPITYADGSGIDKFCPIPSHYRLRMEIFSIGMGLGCFFIPFAYKSQSHPVPLPTLESADFRLSHIYRIVYKLESKKILNVWEMKMEILSWNRSKEKGRNIVLLCLKKLAFFTWFLIMFDELFIWISI